MCTVVSQQLPRCQRKIARRIRHDHQISATPLLAAANIHHEFSDRIQGLTWGGIWAIHLLARRVGLAEALNQRRRLWQAHRNALADALPQSACKTLLRPAKDQVQTPPRVRPERVKEQLVIAREYENVRLLSAEVAEFKYRPTACQKE